MATIRNFTRTQYNTTSQSQERIVSASAAVADIVELDLEPLAHAHVFIGVQLFDSAGDPLDAATAGTFVIKAKTWNTGRWEDITDGSTLSATGLVTASARGSLTGIQVTPTGVAGNDVTTYQVRISTLRS